MKMTRLSLIKALMSSALLLTFTANVRAQWSKDYSWYFNVNYGISQPYCDLQEQNDHISKLTDETKFGYGVQLAKYISPVFAINAQFLRSYLKGSKSAVDAYFNTDYLEYKLGTTINFSNLFFGINHSRAFSVYGTTGLGLATYRAESKRISTDKLIHDYGYEKNADRDLDTREASWVFPMGIGGYFRLSQRFGVNLETVLRLMDSDRLDATVSGPHNDAYYYTSAGLSYNFIKKRKREKIEIPPEETIIAKTDSVPEPRIDFIYHIPDQLMANSDFDMKFTIVKGNLDGFGELMQILPIGFQVLDTAVEGARFEYRNYTANLYWDQLPADTSFTVSYRVHVEDIYGNLPVTSILFFDKTGKEYKFKKEVYVEKFQPEEIVQDTVKPQGPPELEFKVQVRAAYKVQVTEQEMKKYRLTEPLREDFIGNWYRYSIGSFQTYAEAREYRDVVRTKNRVHDAFVVAFRNGVRLNSLSDIKELPVAGQQPVFTRYSETGRVYRVQVLALLHHRIEPAKLKEIYHIDEEIREESYDRWRKYTSPACSTLEEAQALQKKMIDKGITDAFVVIYENGERISPVHNYMLP